MDQRAKTLQFADPSRKRSRAAIVIGLLCIAACAGRGCQRAQLKSGAVPHSLPKGELAGSGVDSNALQTLLAHAKEERSSAIVIVKDGKIVVEMYRDGYDGGPLTAMSASKSIVSIAIGMLIADNKLSLDTRMDALLPEWKDQGDKSTITVRQLLTHTSGLDPSRANFDKQETIREHALKAPLVFMPGTNFQYNNGAVDFLAVVARHAAGIPLDAYLDARLFQKLDMAAASCVKDSEGTARGADALLIRPVDLAKVGMMMLDEGRWNGQQLVPVDWVKRSIDAGQSFDERCGLLWWREGKFAPVLSESVLESMQRLGLYEAAERALPLLGKKFSTWDEYAAAAKAAVGEENVKKLYAAEVTGDHIHFFSSVTDGPVTGFSARGSLGQFLVVLPKRHVVAVRMRAAEASDYEQPTVYKNGYGAFSDDVAKLWP